MREKRVLKNTIISILLQLVILLCGFIVPKLIISNYGSNINGLISSITQFLGYIILLEAGIGPVIRAALYKPLAEKNTIEIENILYTSEKFFRKIAYIFIVYIFVLCILFPIFADKQFNNIFTISLILIISISSFCEYYFGITYRMFLRANQESYIISTVQIITTVLNTLLVYLMIKLNLSIQWVKLISSFVYVVRPLYQYIYFRKKYNYSFSKVDKNYKLSQKWDGLSQHVAAVIHDNTDIVILTIFSDFISVSIYSVYMLVIKGIKSFIDSLTNGIDSAFGDMIAKNEIKILNKSFNKYETIFFGVITIVFSCTLYLITPFVEVYTKGIIDANYIRPIFGYVLVIAEYIYIIRLPYNTLVLSAGLFKKMNKGSWIEALSNLFISILLVYKFGLIGVAIGTLMSMLYRTVDFIVISSKYILNRKYTIIIKRLFISIMEVLILLVVYVNLRKKFVFVSYFSWITFSVLIFICSVFVYVILELVIDRKNFLSIFKIQRRS